MPLFSVIIPTYNRAELLREALDSVWGQTFTDYEVIVIDDGSTDHTAKVVATFGGRARFLQQANKGPGAARNLGLQSAIGDYIAFLDSDDQWFAWTLEVYAQAITENENPNFIAGHGVAHAARAETLSRSWPRTFKKSADFLEASTTEFAFGGTPGMTVQAEAIRAAGGFVERFVNSEDQDLCFRLGTSPGFVLIESPPLFSQRTDVVHVSRDQAKSVGGIRLLLDREATGAYPGGSLHRSVRRRVISATARSVSVSCVESGHIADAMRLYIATFPWQAQLGRWKYCLGFPFFALLRLMSPSKP